MSQISFYETQYYMFSNFSAHAVEYRGDLFMTAEHAYQAAKFDDDAIKSEIQSARSAYAAKEIARQHKTKRISNWDQKKVQIMEEIVRAKYRQHGDVQKALKESGNEEIIENSPIDSFWGTGADGNGRNELGKIWMKLRLE
ncbi:MAG: NADAR family protein [Patescibacteria group bacterium]